MPAKEPEKLILKFLEGLDSVVTGHANIFRVGKSKIDFETKIWHHFHKIEAAEYHYEQVERLTKEARDFLEGPNFPKVSG